ncbi:MAG: biopolymer transporter ExbD [Planctomycetota bacterium]
MRVQPQHRSLSQTGTMTPMIDVVFLLLIFFIWTASFKIAEEQLPGTFASRQPTLGRAPLESESVPAESEIVVLQLQPASDGVQWVINNRVVTSWDEVSKTLSQVVEIDSATPVVIDPAPQVAYGDAIFALDLARSVGLQKVHLAAPEEG